MGAGEVVHPETGAVPSQRGHDDRRVPDALFADPDLAVLYDVFDDDRSDLDPYVALVDEFEARSVLDVGCGTGSFLTRLAAERPDLALLGVDPADASLDVARSKRGADRVRWLHGTADVLSDSSVAVDLAVMTGNVAQVFLTDEEWDTTVDHIARALCAGGVFVFETRDPARRAWTGWTSDRPPVVRSVPGTGTVEQTIDLIEVALPFVTFETRYRFHDRGDAVLRSRSTLRFRDRDELASSLDRAGFEVIDVRNAPDRPGLEWVYVCRRRRTRHERSG